MSVMNPVCLLQKHMLISVQLTKISYYTPGNSTVLLNVWFLKSVLLFSSFSVEALLKLDRCGFNLLSICGWNPKVWPSESYWALIGMGGSSLQLLIQNTFCCLLCAACTWFNIAIPCKDLSMWNYSDILILNLCQTWNSLLNPWDSLTSAPFLYN